MNSALLLTEEIDPIDTLTVAIIGRFRPSRVRGLKSLAALKSIPSLLNVLFEFFVGRLTFSGGTSFSLVARTLSLLGFSLQLLFGCFLGE